jgi:hypothetical protein
MTYHDSNSWTMTEAALAAGTELAHSCAFSIARVDAPALAGRSAS